MDLADIADDIMQMEIRHLLSSRKTTGPEATGECLFCGEPLPDGKRWCNAECRDEWERDQEWQTPQETQRKRDW